MFPVLKRILALAAALVAWVMTLVAAPPHGAAAPASASAPASAEHPAGDETTATDSVTFHGNAPIVSLLTVSPGPAIFELDGHTALRFSTPDLDYVVNWGVFDFDSPNFLYRFVKGETDYMAWPFPTDIFLDSYRRQGRTVTEQRLNLTPAQATMLENLVAVNLEPENRTYRYNYIYDNCATRPLDLIEQATGSKITLTDPADFTYGETGIADSPQMRHTFRTEMARAHADYPWYQFGIDLCLGSGLDCDLTPRMRTYSPLFLKETLETVTTPDGPLVASTEVLLQGVERVTQPPTPWLLTPPAVSIYLLIITLVIALRDLRRHRVTRWFDSVLFSLFTLVGLLLTFLIFVSVHEATSPNWLYLWLNPFCIIPALLIWIKRCKSVVYWYHFCNFAALLALLGIGITGIQQLNSAFYALIIADMVLSMRYIMVGKLK